MSKGSPSADRMISILNYFVSYPRQSFTVAEIVKALKLSRATCNAFMVSLAEAGYLYRGSDRRYMLGPAILEMANRAQSAFAPLDVALLEMRQLADKLDVLIAIHARDGDFVVPQERAASARHLSLSFPPNIRHALHPYGVLFLMSLDDAELEAAFDAASPPLTADNRIFERSLIDFAREHGFLFAVRPDAETPRKPGRSGLMTVGDFVTDLEDQARYRPHFIIAPISDRSGQVVFEVAVSGFDRELSGREVSQIADSIVEACLHVTKFIASRN